MPTAKKPTTPKPASKAAATRPATATGKTPPRGTPQGTTAATPARGQHVGYVRVSSEDQNEARQLDGMSLDRVFTDKASGKDMLRPQLKAALAYLREGDTLHVHSMDRLARNLADLEGIVTGLTARHVTVRFESQGLTFTGKSDPMATLLLQMLGAVAQFERALIRERQREGIALAKERGVYRGRKPKLDKAEIIALREAVAKGEAKAEIARRMGISRATLYEYLAETATGF